MIIIAKSVKGSEFLYSARSAHAVNQRKAAKIVGILNDVRYQLKDGEVWHMHDIDQYDTAFLCAECQRFVLKKDGQLVERFLY